MADKRKLQGEIDRCLKKVAEGVETFEDIWQKVYNAANANQKEKYEADLKKEIKKLQRLRDQIKTWLTSNDIKDKRALMDNRRLIETQMERFKVVERETKTKAYSKEGLGLAAKVDPAQREKEEMREWLSECIVKLKLQIDQFESEMESLHAGSKKKKLDRDKQDRVDELMGWVDRHKFHVQKLETIMRMLDNCSLETDQIKEIQEDLNYYTECNQEPDFCENEMIYDDLNLDEGPTVSAIPIGANTPSIFGTSTAEEEVSSVASSPTSGGPLSPKTPTAMKSTSQELFEERRRGKTTSVSSEQGNEVSQSAVPPSPLRPTSKPLVFNSSFTPLKPISSTSNKMTPTPMSSSSSSSSSTSSAPSSSSSKSAHSLGSPGNNSLINKQQPVVPQQPTATTTIQKNPPPPAKTVQPPAGPAYAVAVGNHQNSLGNLGVPLTNASDSAAPLLSSQLSQPDPSDSLLASSANSGGIVTSTVSVSTTSAPLLLHTNQPQSAQSRSSGPGSVQSQHSRSSSTSSSLSPNPSSSQEVQALSLQQQQQSTLVSSVTSHDSMTVSTSSQKQPAVSPAFGSQVSAGSSPTASPTNEQQVSSSPIHLATAMNMAVPSQVPMVTSSQAASSRDTVRMESIASVPSLATGSQVPPAAVPSLSHGILAAAAAAAAAGSSITNSSTTPSVTSATGSSLSSLSFGGLHPSVVTSFSHQLAGSTPFSPSTGGGSLSGSLATVGSNVSTSVDAFGFPTAIPSPPAANAAAMPLSSLKDMAAEALASTDQFGGVIPKSETQEHLIRPLLDPSVAAPGMRLDGTVTGVSAVGSSNAGIPQMQPLLGVAPLGPIPLSQDRMYQLRMLEAAYKHLPQPSDSERVRPYLQRTPYPSQPYHHQHPPSVMDAFEFFQRLSIDTLFFVFYYMEGTKAQYMAAKALKKLSWRFHTKFMTWFQRLEEPKTITDDYEMGTYIYFDYEKWAQRKRDGFTFEYRYLEDRDLP